MLISFQEIVSESKENDIYNKKTSMVKINKVKGINLKENS
jgi:hypothetical protein